MVAEILSTDADPIREHSASSENALRLRLPLHQSRQMARRPGENVNPRRRSAVDPERKRAPAARTVMYWESFVCAPFPSFPRRGGCATNKKVPFLRGAD